MIKNAAHGLEPGETSSYPASRQAQNYEQGISQTVLKQFGTVPVRFRLSFQLTYTRQKKNCTIDFGF